MILLSGTVSAIAYLVKPAIDEIFLKKDLKMLTLIPIALIIFYFLKGIFDYGQAYLMGYVGNRVVTDLREALYQHTQRLSISFFSKISTGVLMSRISNDVAILQRSVSDAIIKILKESFLIIGLTFVAFYQNWRLAIVSFIVLPAVIIPAVRFGGKSKKFSRRGQEKMGHISTFIDETISGNRIVKAFCMEEYENKRFAKENSRLFRIRLKSLRVLALASPMMELLGGIIGAAVVYYGGYSVIQNEMTPGQFFSFVTAVGMLYKPIKSLNKVNLRIQEGMAAAVRVFEVLDVPPDIQDKPGATPMPPLKESIEFANVEFRYEEKPVLNRVSFKVEADSTVAIVGPSGSGKTTIANLLLRFYDVTAGEILIDGVNIEDRTIQSLRAQIAIVTQETVLFNDTVLNNIAYGSLEKTKEEIIGAAKASFAHEFIQAMPQGYNTVVGEKGVRLSGGQRQKIAIARAILKNAPILILDEATSSLDSRSEKEVQKALENLIKEKTTFLIAHRLSTVMSCNRILVLLEGKIVEQGLHEELLQIKGLYSRLFEMQTASTG
jgi:subfamily B ATP-binding cassette protein MsbA